MSRCFQCMQEYSGDYDMCPFCGYERGTEQKELYFLNTGTMIADRYEIGVSIGSGGFGIMYKAWDHTLAKVVAIKEYYPAGLVNRVPGEKKVIIYSGRRAKECANGKIRFLEEARNMAKFNTHPNIINVYDFFEENNTAYIIMEFLDGANYKEYIREQGGSVPVEKALEITQAVCEALTEVHKTGILHRDISPDNIFLCRDGHIKLIDFGAARFSSTEDEKTRSVILKPGFAPPEQYQTKSRQGPWTDVYALGATLYRAITGTVPEESVNRAEEDKLADPEKLCPDISHNMNNAILRAMALQPELRFQTTAEFFGALNASGTIKDVRKELKFRKMRRLVSIAAASVAVLIGTVICLKVLDQKKAAAAILEATNISIWIPAGEGNAEEEKACFEEALQQFRNDYPQVAVDVLCMEQEAYEEKLEQALAEGSLPTLFDSTGLSVEELGQTEKITSIFTFIEKSDYYFYDQYKTYFPSEKQLPMAFCAPVVYYNTLLKDGKNLSQLVEEGSLLVSEQDIHTYYSLFGKDHPIADTENAEALFLDGKAACLLSDTSQYDLIQQNMAGIYEIELLDEKNQVGIFKDCFSISGKATDEQQAAAVQVLVYLLTDTGQDVRYVQNGNYMPLNKNVYAAYVEINQEFAELSKCFEKLTFAGENQAGGE